MLTRMITKFVSKCVIGLWVGEGANWQSRSERTLRHGIFDAALLGALFAAALALFAKLRKDKWSHALDHAREDRITRVEQPRVRQGWVVEVNAAFEY